MTNLQNHVQSITAYSKYLDVHGLTYGKLGPYFIHGQYPEEKKFIIHISVVYQQIEKLLYNLLPFLIGEKLIFTIPVDSAQHRMIQDGRIGLDYVGKTVNVILKDIGQAQIIAQTLNDLTKDFQGPENLSSIHLLGNLSVSYGLLISEANLMTSKFYSRLHGFNKEGYLIYQLSSDKIKWPFSGIKNLKSYKPSKLLNSKYILVENLKSDPKGQVIKAIKFSPLHKIQWCVIKQGRKNQSLDEYNRDAKSRLIWQFKLYKRLKNALPLVDVIDFFELAGDGYLVFSFVEGMSLNEELLNLQHGIMWPYLEITNKKLIIGYIIAIIEIIEKFHENGIVHRDISPGNFLVTTQGQIIAIDIELCHDCYSKMPFFNLGTPGYMSPQQANMETPTFADDVYSIGALLIKACTSLSPDKLSIDYPNQLVNNLNSLTGSELLSSIIMNCLNQDLNSRFDLKLLKSELKHYAATLFDISSNENIGQKIPDDYENNKSLIQKAINGISSIDHQPFQFDGYSDEEKQLGLCFGASGILYSLILAEKFGFKITGNHKAIDSIFNHLILSFLGSYKDCPGLHTGSYGIVYALVKSMKIKNLPIIVERNSSIYKLAMQPTNHLNLANGISGQGLCLLNLLSESSLPDCYDRLKEIVAIIIDKQEKDGSWKIKNTDDANQHGIKLCGFSFGIAGIVYFLLKYYSVYGDLKVKAAILKTINWLIMQREKNKKMLWTVNDQNSTIEPWLEFGFSGVAMTFVKAFEVLKEPEYKKIATDVLMSNPKYLMSNCLGTSNGIAGLGEIYLEAYRVFADSEWHERANHIANCLSHVYKNIEDNIICWIEGNQPISKSDWHDGTAGIIHFLMRFNNPKEIGFIF